MQCVVLAAGKGTRLRPLTEKIPKPLVPVCGKPILQHIVEALPQEIDEIILVVGYLKEQIEAYCGKEFCGRKVQYVTQENPAGGTGESLRCAETLLKDRFLVMYADDIHGRAALEEALSHQYAMLAVPSNEPQNYGVIELNKDGTLKSIEEKPQQPKSNLINVGGMVLDKKIFSYNSPRSSSGEIYLTDMVTDFAKDYPVVVVEQRLWLPIGRIEDIAKAENALHIKQALD